MTVPSLGSLELDLGDDAIELSLDELVPLSDDLTTEFSDQPVLYAYIAMLAARAEGVWQDSKRYLDNVEAETDKEVRRDFMANGEKTTEARIKAEIRLRKGYVEATEYELYCREQHLLMRALEQAMSMRAQMLISLGAHLRAEAEQTGMLIRDTKAKLDSIKRSK